MSVNKWNAPVTRNTKKMLNKAMEEKNTDEIKRIVFAHPSVLFDRVSTSGYMFLQKMIVEPNQDSLQPIFTWIPFEQLKSHSVQSFLYAVNKNYPISLPIVIEKYKNLKYNG